MERSLRRRRSATTAALIALAAALAAVALKALPAAAGPGNVFTVTNLASNQPGVAPVTDPNLVNGWGLVSGPTTPWWVADNGTDVSTLYRGDTGAKVPLVVTVEGGPTGAVFNGGTGFVVTVGHASGPARFLFASEDGIIRGWNPNVPAAGSTVAQVCADQSHDGAIYKGLAIATTAHGDFLYAADFHNARIDIVDSGCNVVNQRGAFVDPRLPHGYAPFGIRTLGDRVFVAYAKQDDEAEDEEAGPGFGFVDAYDLEGHFLARVASRGDLNAPWGLAFAPDGFGPFGGDLLVGNFGDGHITAYRLDERGRGTNEGQLLLAPGHPLVIDGLWGISFGNGNAAGPTGTLFFAAGPDDESNGLFGSITAG